jgi:hypothetical protein
MSDIQERILNSLDNISDKIHNIDKRQVEEQVKTDINTKAINKLSEQHVRMNDLLADHIKRTELLEKSDAIRFKQIEQNKQQLEEIFIPLRLVKIVTQIIIGGGTVAGAIYGVIKLLAFFNIMN